MSEWQPIMALEMDVRKLRHELFITFISRGDGLDEAALKAEKGINFIETGALLTNQDRMDLGHFHPERATASEAV
ncbi:MAG: hypothetical protein EOP20_11215 [Hyphomicrobiales bacterium]|nr:MAG: hypothetical protein EOP20_11215 [Hyphomicrobiales bacterium]